MRTGAKSRENPTVRIHQQLVRKARLEPRPRLSVLPDLYDWPPARFEPGALDEEGVIRRCKVGDVGRDGARWVCFACLLFACTHNLTLTHT